MTYTKRNVCHTNKIFLLIKFLLIPFAAISNSHFGIHLKTIVEYISDKSRQLILISNTTSGPVMRYSRSRNYVDQRVHYSSTGCPKRERSIVDARNKCLCHKISMPTKCRAILWYYH